jgi:hypothetical protein
MKRSVTSEQKRTKRVAVTDACVCRGSEVSNNILLCDIFLDKFITVRVVAREDACTVQTLADI